MAFHTSVLLECSMNIMAFTSVLGHCVDVCRTSVWHVECSVHLCCQCGMPYTWSCRGQVSVLLSPL